MNRTPTKQNKNPAQAIIPAKSHNTNTVIKLAWTRENDFLIPSIAEVFSKNTIGNPIKNAKERYMPISILISKPAWISAVVMIL